MSAESDRPAEPIVWLRGERAGLGPFVRELVPDYWRWESDPHALVGYGQHHAETVQTRADVFDSQSRSGNPYFTVYDLTDAAPVAAGISAILIDERTRTGELTIVLGAEARGKRLATEATRLTVDYGFHVSNLRNIWLSVLASNTAGLRAYEQAGFKLIGRRRNSGHWLGAIVDHVFMDIIPEDFSGGSVVRRTIEPAPPTS